MREHQQKLHNQRNIQRFVAGVGYLHVISVEVMIAVIIAMEILVQKDGQVVIVVVKTNKHYHQRIIIKISMKVEFRKFQRIKKIIVNPVCVGLAVKKLKEKEINIFHFKIPSA